MRFNIYQIRKIKDCLVIENSRERDAEIKKLKLPEVTSSIIYETDTGQVYNKAGDYIGKAKIIDQKLVIEIHP